jgi:hypothetical protein
MMALPPTAAAVRAALAKYRRHDASFRLQLALASLREWEAVKARIRTTR